MVLKEQALVPKLRRTRYPSGRWRSSIGAFTSALVAGYPSGRQGQWLQGLAEAVIAK
jgi:hypothetical protein